MRTGVIANFFAFNNCGSVIAPSKAGVILSNPGFNTGLLNNGAKISPTTKFPNIKITTVTNEETPTLIMAITSPLSDPGSTFAI